MPSEGSVALTVFKRPHVNWPKRLAVWMFPSSPACWVKRLSQRSRFGCASALYYWRNVSGSESVISSSYGASAAATSAVPSQASWNLKRTQPPP